MVSICEASTYEATVNRSSETQHFEYSDTIEIHNGIMFVFYPGLQLKLKVHVHEHVAALASPNKDWRLMSH